MTDPIKQALDEQRVRALSHYQAQAELGKYAFALAELIEAALDSIASNRVVAHLDTVTDKAREVLPDDLREQILRFKR